MSILKQKESVHTAEERLNMVKMRTKIHLGILVSDTTYLPEMPHEMKVENEYGEYTYILTKVKRNVLPTLSNTI